MLNIIKGKAKHQRVRRSVPKQVWHLNIIFEAEIYSCTAGKDGITPMEGLIGDFIDILEWTKF